MPGEEISCRCVAQRWLISACSALASVALLGLAATPASAVSAARPGDRANVGATHSPELLSQLRDRSGNVPLTGTGEMAPAVLASAAIAGDEQGVDVASFQHPGGAAINWSQVAASGIGFAAVKATEGAYYQNPYALTDLAGAQAAGLSVVAYAFAIPNGNGSSNSPVTQANYLLKYLGSYASTRADHAGHRVQPVLRRPVLRAQGQHSMVAWVAAFDAQIQAKTGRMPIIYTPPAWWDSCTGNSTGFGPDPLWVPSITTGSPVLPAGWANWAIWQYSGTGTVAGIAAAKGHRPGPGQRRVPRAAQPGHPGPVRRRAGRPPAAAGHPGPGPDGELHRDRPAARGVPHRVREPHRLARPGPAPTP